MHRNLAVLAVLGGLLIAGVAGQPAKADPPASAPLAVTTIALPDATAADPYSATLTADNGTPPYIWLVSAGELPAGLTLLADGTLTGTPRTSAYPAFEVKVADSGAVQKTATRILSIRVVPPRLVVVTASMVGGYAKGKYIGQLEAAGGVPPYTWTSTALPAGLTLSTSGAITGVATAAGTTSVTFAVTDANGTVTKKTLGVTIGGQPTYETPESCAEAYVRGICTRDMRAISYTLQKTERDAYLKAADAGAKPASNTPKFEFVACKKTLIDQDKAAVLVHWKVDGQESPFPVSLVKEDSSWRVTQTAPNVELITKLMTPE